MKVATIGLFIVVVATAGVAQETRKECLSAARSAFKAAKQECPPAGKGGKGGGGPPPCAGLPAGSVSACRSVASSSCLCDAVQQVLTGCASCDLGEGGANCKVALVDAEMQCTAAAPCLHAIVGALCPGGD